MNNNYSYNPYKSPDNMMINGMNMMEEKDSIFSEDILSKNKGKYLKIYMSFSDSVKWCDRIFEGYLEAWGKDFILLFDKKNNKRYMVWNLYIDFIEFTEPVNI